MVDKGYPTKLLANVAVKRFISRHDPETRTHQELVVNTVSIEEAVQQQLDSEVSEPMGDIGAGTSQRSIARRAEGSRNCTIKTGPRIDHPVAKYVSIFESDF